ncbi:hypothetical protein JCM10207_005824 [Rhodosporidiobolus poonsookiae]
MAHYEPYNFDPAQWAFAQGYSQYPQQHNDPLLASQDPATASAPPPHPHPQPFASAAPPASASPNPNAAGVWAIDNQPWSIPHAQNDPSHAQQPSSAPAPNNYLSSLTGLVNGVAAGQQGLMGMGSGEAKAGVENGTGAGGDSAPHQHQQQQVGGPGQAGSASASPALSSGAFASNPAASAALNNNVELYTQFLRQQAQAQAQAQAQGSLAAAVAQYGLPMYGNVPPAGPTPPGSLQIPGFGGEGDVKKEGGSPAGSAADADGERDEGAAGAVGGEGYNPENPYINSLRAPGSGAASPIPVSAPSPSHQHQQQQSAPYNAAAAFASSLPASLAAYTGLAPRSGSPYRGAYEPAAAAAAAGIPTGLVPPQQAPGQPGAGAAGQQGYKADEPPEIPYESDDSQDGDFGTTSKKGGAAAKGKGRAAPRGRARARKPSQAALAAAAAAGDVAVDGDGELLETSATGFAIPRVAGTGETRDGSRDSSATAGSSSERSRKRLATDDSDNDVGVTLTGQKRGPGSGFAPPRRQTEIPAVEDDPSVRPYGCNYCALALVAAQQGVASAYPAPPAGQALSWRTIKELREHHTATHKAQQKELDEAGDEAVLMEMPFRCALDPCGKTFKSLAGLRFHFQNASANGHFFVQLEKDDQTGEERATKKFKQEVKPSGRELGCPIRGCPKRFKQSAGLAYHLSHTPNHPITLAMLETFEPTLMSKTKWWFGRLGKEWAIEEA